MICFSGSRIYRLNMSHDQYIYADSFILFPNFLSKIFMEINAVRYTNILFSLESAEWALSNGIIWQSAISININPLILCLSQNVEYGNEFELENVKTKY